MDILRKATRRQWRRILPNMATLILNQAATHLTVTVAILLQATLQAVWVWFFFPSVVVFVTNSIFCWSLLLTDHTARSLNGEDRFMLNKHMGFVVVSGCGSSSHHGHGGGLGPLLAGGAAAAAAAYGAHKLSHHGHGHGGYGGYDYGCGGGHGHYYGGGHGLYYGHGHCHGK
jgi:hypothetical protein